MPARVIDLQPGDLVEQAGERAVFITRTQHPAWPALDLVIWRLADGTLSLDALVAQQEVGVVVNAADSPAERWDRLIRAIRPQGR